MTCGACLAFGGPLPPPAGSAPSSGVKDRLPRDDPRWGWEFQLEDFVFARLVEAEAELGAMPEGEARAAETARLRSLRRIAAVHSIYIHADGTNAGQCFTCEPAHGVPCLTMVSLAAMWPDHPDMPSTYEPGAWLEEMSEGTFRRRYERRQAAELGEPGLDS